MDKKELLTNLKDKRNAWNQSLINTMKENIKTEASLKILNDIIAEVEDAEEEEKPDFLSLDEIVKGMKDYCDLVYRYSECNGCPFHHHISDKQNYCLIEVIEANVANNKKN